MTGTGRGTIRTGKALARTAATGLLLVAASLSGCGGSLDGTLGAGTATEVKAGLEQPGPAKAVEAATPAVPQAEKPVRVVAVAAGAEKAAALPRGSEKQLAKTAETVLAVSTPGSTGYKIGPQDILDITVFKVAELSRTVQVSETGSINFPLIGEVPAAGRTATQLERELAAKLGVKYLRSPQVTVATKEYNSQRVTVEGAVKKPGVYPLRGRTTLLQLIAVCEGPTEVADSDIVVFRQSGGKRQASRFNIDEMRAGRLEDPLLESGDVVIASESGMKTAFQNVMKAVPLANFIRLVP